MALTLKVYGGPDDAADGFEQHWRNGMLKAHLLSDVGKKRSRNQDYCILCAPPDPYDGVLCAVADGMGGVNGGEYASRLAMETLAEAYYLSTYPPVPERLKYAVQAGNRRIYSAAAANPEFHGMGTTVSALAVKNNYCYLAQVGDSRVYIARRGHPVRQLTEDHSLVAEQVRSGYLSEAEARHHAMKNLITRAVGTRETVDVDLFHLRIQRDDVFIICSDGLSNVVDEAGIDEALALPSLKGAARRLVGSALEAGGPDNITVALIQVSGDPPRGHAEEGAAELRPFAGGLRGLLRRALPRRK